MVNLSEISIYIAMQIIINMC